jgi:tetratricopeptide (TPR) repeat protein
LERAEGRVSELAPADLRDQVRSMQAEVAFVGELEEARLQAAIWGNNGFDFAAADGAYKAAFAKHDLDVKVLSAQEAGRRIRDSRIRARLVAGLDNWAYAKDQLHSGEGEPLRAIARALDDDRWRQQLRDPAVRRDSASLERLARSPAALAQPPVYVALLVRALRQNRRPWMAERLLRRVQLRHPADFWLNFDLGNFLEGPSDIPEKIGYYRAALALRPDTFAVYTNLAKALDAQGRMTESLEAFRKAVNLQPNVAMGYYNLGTALGKRGQLPEAVRTVRKAVAIRRDYADAHNTLGTLLHRQGNLGEAVKAYRKAVAIEPTHAMAHYNLGNTFADEGKLPEAVEEFRKAIALDPRLAEAHNNLGNALKKQGKRAAAEQAYRKAIDANPKLAPAYAGLGDILREQGKPGQAVQACRQAIELNPDFATAYANLGAALRAQRKPAEALQACRQALRLQPKDAHVYNTIGACLMDQGKLTEAEQAWREALTIQPEYASPYKNLSIALARQGRLAEAVRFCRKAIALKPQDAEGYNMLGTFLAAQRQLAEAVQAYRQAIDVRPGYAGAHYNLGHALLAQGKLAEAGDAFSKAATLKPDLAEAHCNLGQILLERGDSAKALASLRRGHRLGSRRPGWPYPSARWVKNAERLVQLDAQLPKVLEGLVQPRDTAERIAFADLCRKPLKQRYAAAARFYADAFAAEPKLAEDLHVQNRYNAACAAALASCGQGKDAAGLNAKERPRLRRQALAWLRADLGPWTQRLNAGKPPERKAVQQTLEHWQTDPDLAGVRDQAALAKLPEAERQEWAKLWAEVATLLAKATPKK